MADKKLKRVGLYTLQGPVKPGDLKKMIDQMKRDKAEYEKQQKKTPSKS